MDKDLLDHGALAYDTSIKVPTRDLPDTDLSDHGALPYDRSMKGPIRDLPDTDLSDHGALAYASKESVWGTNDEELTKQIQILLNATYYGKLDEVIPILGADSLAKIVNYRYRQSANILDSNRYGLGKDAKERLGVGLNMDFLIINSMITLNPTCMENIFDPSLYVGSNEQKNIEGVLDEYQKALGTVNVDIPLINGATDEVLAYQSGKPVTAQDMINHLKSKIAEKQVEQTTGMAR